MVNEPVIFRKGDRRVEGWTLNISHGGLRAILDDSMAIGEVYDVFLVECQHRRRARVVWVQEEKDGAVVGISFVDRPLSTIPGRREDKELGEDDSTMEIIRRKP